MCRIMLTILLTLVLSTSIHPEVLASGGSEDGGRTSAPVKGYASPHGVFAAYRKALKERDWPTVFSCLSPQYRDACVWEVIFVAGMRKEPRLEATLKKYGVHLNGLDGEYASRRDKTEPAREFVLKRVTDKARLFAEGKAIIEKPGSTLPRLGPLEQLTSDGAAATGRVNSTGFIWESVEGKGIRKVEQTLRTEVYFVKRNARWFLASSREELQRVKEGGR